MMWISRLSAPLSLALCAAALVGSAALLPHHTPAAAPAAITPRPPAEEAADELSVASLPAVVVKSVPQAGTTDVDAAEVKEIKVTFSKDMGTKSWSWSQVSDESFPKTAGKVRFEKDNRTCVMPVKLEPGKTYVIWINSQKFNGFKDTDGMSSVPYLLVFQTKK